MLTETERVIPFTLTETERVIPFTLHAHQGLHNQIS